MSDEIAVYEPLETSLIRPAGDIAEIEQAFRDYQAICSRLLDASDYQTYDRWNPDTRRREPTQFKKRSAWRKLATAMGVRFEIVRAEKTRNEAGRTVSADFIARAIHPNGRYSDGWGNCDAFERCTDKCNPGCNGIRHFSKPEHDIPATAETRAKNRAAADLFGLGEVSAEEMQGAPVVIEDAEVVTDPDGSVFPDQRDAESMFQPPADVAKRGSVTDAQLKNIRRLVTKLQGMGQDESTLRDSLEMQYGTRSFSALEKGQAVQVISALMGMAGEEPKK